MLQSTRFHALLLFILTGLPFLGVFRGDMWLPMVGDIAPPWGPPPATRIEDSAGSDLPGFTYPNLLVESHARPWNALSATNSGDPGAVLWNPGQLCGTPFLATQSTFALHPAHLLPWTAPLSWQFAALAWAHAWIAALGCYFLSRRLELDRIPALFSGITFGMGPWMTAHHDTLASMTAAWIPWLIAGGIHVVGSPRFRPIVSLAAVTAIAALSGMAQLLQIGLVAVGLSIREGFDESLRTIGNRNAARGLLRLGFAILLGLSLAAPQLIPLVELAVEAPRSQSASQLQNDLAVPWQEWLTMGWPEVAGTPVSLARASQFDPSVAVPPENAWPMAKLLRARANGGTTYMEAPVSPGSCIFTIAILGLVLGRHRARTLAIILGVVGFLVSTRGPWFDFLQHIPTVAVGNPRRWLVLTALGGAMLVGVGVQTLPTISWSWRRTFGVLAAFPTLVWLACFLFPGALSTWLSLATDTPLALAKLNLTSILIELWIPAILCGTVAVMISLRHLPKHVVLFLISCVIIDASTHALRVNPLIPSAPVFPPTRTTDFLLKEHTSLRDPLRSSGSSFGARTVPWRIARLASTDANTWIPPLPPNTPMVFGLRDAAGYEALIPRRLEDLWSAVEPGSVHEHHYLRPFNQVDVPSLPLMDFMGIRYWLATRADIPTGLNRVAAFVDERTAIFENPRWLRHATWLNRVRIVATEQDAISVVASRAFNPREEVILTCEQATSLGLGVGPPRLITVGDDTSDVTDVTLTAAKCEFKIDGTSDGLLVIAESYHRGWTARDQNAKALPLAIANHAFQAIFVPKGTTTITWAFEPATWRFGLATALGALLIIIVGGILARRNAS